jgi:lipid II:glycine glycyltransferase (peptidoglycan interpeptide bridge formation enzyme)
MSLFIKRSKLFFSWHEYYFFSDKLTTVSGLVYIIQAFNKPKFSYFFIEFRTRIIDLRMDEEIIFKAFKSNTRNEIRNVEGESIDFSFILQPDFNDIKNFCDFYSIFAKKKKLRLANPDKLLALCNKGGLVIASVVYDNEIIAFHVYIKSIDRARLLYSATNYNLSSKSAISKVGKFNRLLHWMDIKEFKKIGVSTYDLGGIGKESIANFKNSFGGVSIVEYSYVKGSSFVTRVISSAINMYLHYAFKN